MKTYSSLSNTHLNNVAYPDRTTGKIVTPTTVVDGVYYQPISDSTAAVRSNPDKYSGNVEIKSEVSLKQVEALYLDLK